MAKGTILITGAAGFIGSTLVDKLLDKNYRVVGVDNLNDFYDPKIKLENNEVFYSIAPEGITVGQEIKIGSSAPVQVGNIIPLSSIMPGTLICNLELNTGDGGKIVRSSGAYATVVTQTPKETIVKLPSGKSLTVNNLCLATVGIVSGGGRTEKPFVKAGKHLAWMKTKGKVYPTSKGIAMVPASHPHGGGSHSSSSLRPTTVSRTAPPGQKVGIIAARRTGRKKKD